MKLLNKMGFQGSRNVWLGCAAAALLCIAGATAYAAEVVETQQTAVLPWISDVVKMNDAGVPPDLLANYIKNSPARSSLSADDIIYLKNRGVSSTIITEMIQHGATAPSAYAPQPAPVYAQPQYAQPQPQVVYQQPAADQQPVTVYNDYSDDGYAQNDYPYYPYYYGYNYPTYYPYFYSFPLGFGFHRNFGGFGGRGFGRAGFPGIGFHGGIGGFHGSGHVGGFGHGGGRR